ncbi:MAG: PorV/PorQ family protein [Calditrichaeota bacterium]|nr:PorV/PorQ family protein [Calditrichota bacterium]MCB9367807.1 PorV/PorQ family protein [Calditrichota bacterium]
MINVRCLGLVLTLSLFVQVANAQWVIGRYAGEFLSLGAGARALAMGGASIASPLPATAGYYNPAGLAGIDKRSVEFMHASQFDNLFTYDYLSFATPMQREMSGAVTVLYSRVGDIPLTRLADPTQPLSDGNRVEVDGQTGDHEWAAIASGGRMLGNGWNAGASAKILTKSVASETAVGLGFDVGLQRMIGSRTEFGAVVRDITTSTMAWSTGRTESILPTVGFGGRWSAPLKAMNADVTVVADAETRFETRGEAEVISAGPVSIEPRIGAEYLISKTVALRAGLKGDRFTAGAGLLFGSLAVNAALEDHNDLGLTHRVSVGVVF